MVMATRIQRLRSQCLAILARPLNLIWEGGGYFLICELSERNWRALFRAKNAPDARKLLNLRYALNGSQVFPFRKTPLGRHFGGAAEMGPSDSSTIPVGGG